MDEAPLRHGVSTIHQFASTTLYKHESNQPKARRTGESQAILVGDMVFNMVFKLLHELNHHHLPQLAKVQAIFHTLIEEVCLGQMVDIDLTAQNQVTEADVVAKNRLKTAYYSFVRPLHIGALLALRDDLIPFIHEFGEAVGLLYQVQDDLLDIVGDPVVTKKETFQDITQFQHTVLSTHVRSHGGRPAALLESLSGRTLTIENKNTLKEAFITSGAIAHAESLIESYIDKASTAYSAHHLSPKDEAMFSSLLSLIYKRTT
jgi:geranylgeranyl diphosphate synthase type I